MLKHIETRPVGLRRYGLPNLLREQMGCVGVAINRYRPAPWTDQYMPWYRRREVDTFKMARDDSRHSERPVKRDTPWCEEAFSPSIEKLLAGQEAHDQRRSDVPAMTEPRAPLDARGIAKLVNAAQVKHLRDAVLVKQAEIDEVAFNRITERMPVDGGEISLTFTERAPK